MAPVAEQDEPREGPVRRWGKQVGLALLVLFVGWWLAAIVISNTQHDAERKADETYACVMAGREDC